MNSQRPLAKSEFSLMRFDLRPLTENDVDAYRALRSKIRNGDGARNFADSYTKEDRLDEQSWREWCAVKREHYIVGAFDKEKKNKLASIMMVTGQGPANSLIAEWETTWIEPEYRSSGLAKFAYEEVSRLTKEFGYQHAAVFIRHDNHHSRAIREKQGFTYLATHDVEWADRTIAPSNLYILDLFPDSPAEQSSHERAKRRLKDTLESMKGEVPFIGEALRKRITALQDDVEALQVSHRDCLAGHAGIQVALS